MQPATRTVTAGRAETEATSDLLVAILTGDNPDRMRVQYLRALGMPDVEDWRIVELFESQLFAAMYGNEPTITLDRGLAELLLLILKQGERRPKGGRFLTPPQELRKHTLVSMALRIKERLIAEGSNATQAHHKAAEDAAQDASERGIAYKPSYIAREMDRAIGRGETSQSGGKTATKRARPAG